MWRNDFRTPMALRPEPLALPPLAAQVVGLCQAEGLPEALRRAAADMGLVLTAEFLAQEGPVSAAAPRPPAGGFDLKVMVPPFRWAHPRGMDGFVRVRDPAAFLAEAREHLAAYLASAAGGHPAAAHFAVGFLEPTVRPEGKLAAGRSGDYRAFVRRLNDEIAGWCRAGPDRHFVDADEIAATLGKMRVCDDPVASFAHRFVLTDWDDAHDRGYFGAGGRVADRFEMRAGDYLEMLAREVLAMVITLSGVGRVKAVLVDLDGTLWRGSAAEDRVGSFEGRPNGFVEALLLLKERGILLGIASKNDERFVRESWDFILNGMPASRLATRLALDDFAVRRIDYRPKSETVRELVAELGLLPESVVFIDDDPLEREEVRRGVPGIRVLGGEPLELRWELLNSPFTQVPVLTAEDRRRTESAAARAERERRLRDAPDREEFLRSLGLECRVRRLGAAEAARVERARQLLSRTTQWRLNAHGYREAELARRVAEGEVWVAEARDLALDHGLVAVLVAAARGAVEQMAVSCRVLGLGVEEALLAAVRAAGGARRLLWADTGRNRAAAGFLERHLPAFAAGAAGDVWLELPEIPVPGHLRVEAGSESDGSG